MNIAAVQGTGPIYEPAAAGKPLSTGVYRPPIDIDSVTLQTDLKAVAAGQPATSSPQLTERPAPGVIRSATGPDTVGVRSASTAALPAATGGATGLQTPATTGIAQTVAAGQAGLTNVAGKGSLLAELRDYTKTASQEKSQAYQEYAKAWGGRVVHGEVEFPPLSIYLE